MQSAVSRRPGCVRAASKRRRPGGGAVAVSGAKSADFVPDTSLLSSPVQGGWSRTDVSAIKWSRQRAIAGRMQRPSRARTAAASTPPRRPPSLRSARAAASGSRDACRRVFTRPIPHVVAVATNDRRRPRRPLISTRCHRTHVWCRRDILLVGTAAYSCHLYTEADCEQKSTSPPSPSQPSRPRTWTEFITLARESTIRFDESAA